MQFREEWLTQLEERFGKVDAIHPIQCENEEKPTINVFFFHKLPEDCLTAITCGLSNAKMKEWKYGKPELIVTLDTSDISWGLAAGYFASAFFNEKRFQYGDLFTLDKTISDESKMSAFFVFAPSFLSPDEARFELNDRIINLACMYPLYPEEVNLYTKIGLEQFWHLEGFDMYNVLRRNLAQSISPR